jgi:hypothetical protein
MKKRMSQADLDEKVYGPEPDPSSIIKEDQKKIFLIKSLGWYSQSFDKKKCEPFVLDWVKENLNHTKQEVNKLSSNFHRFHPTFFGLMKLESNGYILSESELNRVQKHVQDIIQFKNGKTITTTTTTTDNSDTNVVVVRNPQALLREKVNKSILADLEGMIDQWLYGKTLAERKEVYPFEEKIRSYEIKGSVAINMIKEFLMEKIKEFNASKNDDAYSLLPGNVNRTVKFLQEFHSSLDLIKIETKNRKQRKKKVTKNTVSLSNVKYQKESTEFKISSIPPENILKKSVVYLFDTKYRVLRVLYSNSPDGFAITGTTIQNFDDEKSFSIRLRKPLEFLPIVLTKTKFQIEKQVERLTTKPTTTTGRLNDNVVILRGM